MLKSVSDARSNEIKKLRGVAGDIFDLPGKYFTNPQYDRTSITEIQKMLGVSTADPAYKVFPPLLFPGLQEDLTRKTIFGNWILFAKVHTTGATTRHLQLLTLLLITYIDAESRAARCYITSSRYLWWLKDQCSEVEFSTSHTRINRMGCSYCTSSDPLNVFIVLMVSYHYRRYFCSLLTQNSQVQELGRRQALTTRTFSFNIRKSWSSSGKAANGSRVSLPMSTDTFLVPQSLQPLNLLAISRSPLKKLIASWQH